MVFTDHLNRILQLSKTPERIISLVPSQSELIYDLGLNNNLVGVTKFCVHPKQLKATRTVVGGTKNVDIEKIKALKPDIILCNKEENTPELVSELEKITAVHVSDINTILDASVLIADYGKLFNVSQKATEINKKIALGLEGLKCFLETKKELNVAYFIWRNPWMVAASNTFINSILNLNKFNNVYSDGERYPIISLKDERLVKAEAIFLSSEPYPFADKHKKELQQLFPDTPVTLVNGEYFSWYGTRLILALDYFKSLPAIRPS